MLLDADLKSGIQISRFGSTSLMKVRKVGSEALSRRKKDNLLNEIVADESWKDGSSDANLSKNLMAFSPLT